MSQNKTNLLRQRVLSLFFLIVLACLGLWMWRFYRGHLQELIRFYISGIVYVMIVSLFFFTIFPGEKNVRRVPLVVFILTCCLEFLQLYKPPFLQAIRSTFLGAALIGTSFVWLQFPFYIIGAILSYLLLKFIFSMKKNG